MSSPFGRYDQLPATGATPMSTQASSNASLLGALNRGLGLLEVPTEPDDSQRVTVAVETGLEHEVGPMAHLP